MGWDMLAVALTSVGIAVVAARSIASGAPDQYQNQHVRLHANSLSTLFLSTGHLILWRADFKRLPPLGWLLAIAACCTIAWSFWLAR